jgi:hypothetical protein
MQDAASIAPFVRSVVDLLGLPRLVISILSLFDFLLLVSTFCCWRRRLVQLPLIWCCASLCSAIHSGGRQRALLVLE